MFFQCRRRNKPFQALSELRIAQGHCLVKFPIMNGLRYIFRLGKSDKIVGVDAIERYHFDRFHQRDTTYPIFLHTNHI